MFLNLTNIYKIVRSSTIETGIKYSLATGNWGQKIIQNKMGIAHHDHIVCLDCKNIVEFMNEEIEVIQDQIAEKMGFEIVRHVHQLFGNCLDKTCPNKP